MPQRDLPAALAVGDRQRLAGAAKPRRVARGGPRADAEPLFERLGLAGFGARSARASSRAGCASGSPSSRTLLAGKPVLLLDEPFASLDAITRGEMQEWLAAALAAEPRTVDPRDHDVEEALYLCRPRRWSCRRARRGSSASCAAPRPRAAPRADAVTAPAFLGGP